MLTRKHSIDGKRPFSNADDFHSWLGIDGTSNLVMLAGDVSLLLDSKGKIVDAAGDESEFPGFESWIGKNWLDTVTVESRPKVMELLAAARKKGPQRWRQVNHATAEGDIPVKYGLVATDHEDRFLAIGRDLRDMGEMQQRMLQAQQSLERDYAKLRQLETRYRLLFERMSEPVLVVEGTSLRIQEANAAAHNLIDAARGSLVGNKLSGLFVRASREQLLAFIGSAMASTNVAPMEVPLAKTGLTVSLTATGFMQLGEQYVIIRLLPPDGVSDTHEQSSDDIIEQMPDAFVIADEAMNIIHANLAFVELAQAASLDQLRGEPLGAYLGRPGIDLDMIEKQIGKHGSAHNVNTVVRSASLGDGEPVELSAVSIGDEAVRFGFVIRQTGRRMLEPSTTADELPRSVEQLSELVGRMSLKEIVRESTDLIEKMCIEAALSYTSNNRASAAEILGLSRQSLYSKLHKFGLSGRPDDA